MLISECEYLNHHLDAWESILDIESKCQFLSHAIFSVLKFPHL